MNLVQLSNELEYVPKNQLADMAQDPNNRFPQYLVLSEIQRRTQMEKMYAAAAQRPETTVSEEVVNNFAGMPSDSAPTDVFSQEGMSAPIPEPLTRSMQMASGGLTGYANGGELDTTNNINSIDQETENKVVEFVKENPWAAGLGAASLVALVAPVPGARPVAGALAAASKAVQYGPKLIQAGSKTLGGLKNLYNRGLVKLGAGQARKDIKSGKFLPQFIGGKSGTPTPPNYYQNLGKQRLKNMRLGQRGLAGGTAFAIGNYALNDKTNEIEPETKKELSEFEKAFQEAQLAQLEADKNKSKFNFDNVDTNLIGLGGVVMGASSPKELGAGLTNFATGLNQAKSDAAKAEYYAANTAKIEAEVANMPLDSVLTNLTAAQKQYEAALEQGNEEQKQEAYNIVRALSNRAIELQGLEQMVGASADINLAKSFMT
tara:strand:- start:936 stop:2231 length:1296 start_codon:yes stop_codon:yes gene_type:complete